MSFVELTTMQKMSKVETLSLYPQGCNITLVHGVTWKQYYHLGLDAASL